MKKITVFSIMLIALFTVLAMPVIAGGQQEAQKEVVLNWPCIWVGEDAKADAVADIVAKFNEEHAGQIKVQIEEMPDYDIYDKKILAQISGGQVPDIFTLKWNPDTKDFYSGDILVDFSEDLAGGWGNRFDSSIINEVTLDGQTKVIPYEMAITPIWYNADLFAEAGIDGFPKTYDEFWDAAEKLKAIDVTPTSQMTGGANAWTSMLWYSHIMASVGGPGIWDKPLSDPAYVKGAEILKRLYSNGNTTKDAIGGGPSVPSGHYLAERTAVFCNGPWFIGNIRENAPEVYESTELTSAPAAAGGEKGAQIGFIQTVLASGATDDPAKREAALTFLQYMSQPENVKRISMDSGALMVPKFTFSDSDDVDPLQKKFVEAQENASFVMNHLAAKFPASVVQEFGAALDQLALGRATPEEFVQMLEAAND
ncbi:MAG: extracellular solute-binding protein [Spirochaetia bacterium]|nr:extracellular solute-binding protein [Spirochaetia bacterium]